MRSKGAAGLGARQASPRTLAIAGGVILVVIVAVVLGIVLTQKSGGGTNNGNGDGTTVKIATGTPAVGNSSSASALPGAADVAKMFKGIPQEGFILGKATAPVQLTEYIDLQCPACQFFETQQLAELLTKYVRPGKLSIKMQTWNIIDANHPGSVDSLRGQKATIAAAAQNKAFNFAEVLYDNQGLEGTGWMNDAMISNIAASVDGLDPYALATTANSAATQHTITTIDNAARAAQFLATPTLLLGKPPAKPRVVSSGAPDLPTLEGQIDALLK